MALLVILGIKLWFIKYDKYYIILYYIILYYLIFVFCLIMSKKWALSLIKYSCESRDNFIIYFIYLLYIYIFLSKNEKNILFLLLFKIQLENYLKNMK